MIDEETEAILADLFGRHTGWENEKRAEIALSPGFEHLRALAGLLRRAPAEEDLQRFLAEYPQFLLGFAGLNGDQDLAFLTKPPIGTQYRADFATLSVSQGGANVELFEIEPSSAPLFTKSGTPARRLQGALGQLRDWHQWIEPNKAAFVRDMIRLAKNVPRFPTRSENLSFRLRESQDIENAWTGFGGYVVPRVHYHIIIGRWCQLSPEHRQRLIFMNREDGVFQQVITFDQVARRAYARPLILGY